MELNKNWGKLVGKKLEYAPIDLVVDGVLISPATDEAYEASGYKRIVRSVQPDDELDEWFKWDKSLKQNESTIYYEWSQVKKTEAEYLLYCHEQLTETNKKMINYYEGEYPEEKYLYWKSKRKVWRDFIREHEQ